MPIVPREHEYSCHGCLGRMENIEKIRWEVRWKIVELLLWIGFWVINRNSRKSVPGRDHKKRWCGPGPLMDEAVTAIRSLLYNSCQG